MIVSDWRATPRKTAFLLTLLCILTWNTAFAEDIVVEEDGDSAPTSTVLANQPAAVVANPPLVGLLNAHLKGQFGPLFAWPEIIPIHLMNFPDGRVLSFNTSPKIHYIWDPAKGTGPDAFSRGVNVIGTTAENNIFCSGQILLPPETPNAGKALSIGGTLNNVGPVTLGMGKTEVTVIDPRTNSFSNTPSMVYPRWYPTAVTLLNKETLVLGGRIAPSSNDTGGLIKQEVASTPEVRGINGNWRTLANTTSNEAYGLSNGSWYYPQAWIHPRGGVFILTHNTAMFHLNPTGGGTLSKYTNNVEASSQLLASIMYEQGKILSIRNGRRAVLIDINTPNTSDNPVIRDTGYLQKDRKYGSLTVLADGSVWAHGGGSDVIQADTLSITNAYNGSHYVSELWNPVGKTADELRTLTWTPAAESDLAWATLPPDATSLNKYNIPTRGGRVRAARLYHSNALLLKDGSVLTGGGGTPGPVNNLNAEIYYPPYLFDAKDNFIPPANRPTFTSDHAAIVKPGDSFMVSINSPSQYLTKVTLVRVGAATHNFNNETRFVKVALTRLNSLTLNVTIPTKETVPPGYYMLFAWNGSNVPSMAKIIAIGM